MRGRRPSTSAQAVATARAHLDRLGVIDDPWARTLLTRRRRALVRALGRWPLARYGRSATFTFLVARTAFFDAAVIAACDAGVRQVVLVGAGYDARAWRLARSSVRFHEVDHPATQADKRRRAPAAADGADVVHVRADLRVDPIDEALRAAGFAGDRPAVFVLEGLTMYLEQPVAEALLAGLAAIAAPGSRLAANFTAAGGGSVSLASRAVARAVRTRWHLAGEPTHYWASRAGLPAILARNGWTMTDLIPGPELAARHTGGTVLRTTGVNPDAFCVSARPDVSRRRRL